MTFRVAYEVLGEHVHCTLWVAPKAGATAARAGQFVLRLKEFTEFSRRTPPDLISFEEREEKSKG